MRINCEGAPLIAPSSTAPHRGSRGLRPRRLTLWTSAALRGLFLLVLLSGSGCLAYKAYSGYKAAKKVGEFTEDHVMHSHSRSTTSALAK